MRVGITILTQEGHNIWNNGIGQNIYFLASLLEGIPFVEQVVLLDCGDQGRAPDYAGAFANRFPLVPLREATDLVDVAIEVSGGLNAEWTDRFRARGGHVVFHVCGQPYASFVEPTTFDRPGFFSEAERCDEVWILAKDAPFTAWLRAIHRCPVYQTPYLWAPDFLDDTARMITQDGLSFGYKPGTLSSSPAIPAIFEPNISPIKMGLIPFLICEEVERAAPDAIARLHFMNTDRIKAHRSMVFLVGNCDLYRAGKVSIEARDYFARVMGRGANMVISHQITCPQNYLYLDALHGRYPLIHNSPMFADVGYYYPDSDIAAGAMQMRNAIVEHDRNLDWYAGRAAAKIASLSPDARANRDAYARRLLALSQRVRRRRAA